MNCANHPDAPADQLCSVCSKSFCRDCVVELGGQTLCASCKEEKIREMKSGLSGPDLASVWSRLGAAILDGLVFAPITLGVYWVYRGDTGIFQDFVPRTILPALAWVIYEWQMLAHGGQTLGKMALGIKVVAADGAPLEGQALARAGSRQLMALTIVLALVDDLMIFTEGHRTLHDRIAKTAVINWKR
jgi:uncharacterized RDD family membrane protein YckC